jgi:HEAT repeat protein
MPTFNLISETEPVDLVWLLRQEPATRREVIGELAERGRPHDLDMLVESLKDAHPGVQESAARHLVHIGGDTIVRRLIGMLREPPAVRNVALEVIGQLLPSGIETLVEALRSQDPEIRKFIIDCFGQHHDPRLIPPLLPMLSDLNANVRAAAAEALGHLRAQEAIPQLVGLLQDEQWVAFSAIAALADIGSGAAVESLINVVKRGDLPVAYAALEAIARLDQDGVSLSFLLELGSSVGRELQPALIKTLVALAERGSTDLWAQLDRASWTERLNEALQAEDPDVRCAAMIALGLLGETSSAEAILDMYACLEDPAEDTADRAVQALVGTGNVAALIKACQSEEDERIAKVAIRALGVMRTPEAVPNLGQIRRSSSDWDRRRLAVIALGMIGTEEAIEFLIEAVDDETGYVRREAVHLLGDVRTESAVLALVSRLKKERYQEVRNEIGDALVRIATPTVRTELLQALQHRRAEVRETAAMAIGKSRWEEGLEPLMESMNDCDARVRRAVVEAIARYFDARLLRSLLVALSDTDEKVRLAALIGIGRWRTQEAHEALLSQGLRDTDVWVRYRAVELLGAHGVESAVPALCDIIASPQEPKLVKRAAIGSLASIGGTRALTALGECLQLADPDLRDAAVRAVQRQDGASSV